MSTRAHRRPAIFALVSAAALAACGSGSEADPGYSENASAPAPGADGGDAASAPDAPDASTPGEPTPKPDASAEAGPDAAAAPYPIVLAHGFFGFDDFAGAHFLTYFYGVKAHLAAQGEPLVFTPIVDPFSSSAERGAQLTAQIEDILATTGKSKVVIVGHSQGGLDARVVAHEHPELVAGVVTIATPHEGTPVSDAVLLAAPGPISKAIVDGLGKLVGGVINPMTGQNDSLVAALRQFSSAEIPQFNTAYPDVPGIPYWSIAGRSFLSSGGTDCDVPGAPPWITKWDANRDPCNALLAVLAAPMIGQDNDGLVPLKSAKHGQFLGCLPADHLDQIGQILGQPPGLGNSFDYLQFWTDFVHWIRAQGL